MLLANKYFFIKCRDPLNVTFSSNFFSLGCTLGSVTMVTFILYDTIFYYNFDPTLTKSVNLVELSDIGQQRGQRRCRQSNKGDTNKNKKVAFMPSKRVSKAVLSFSLCITRWE